MPTIATHTPTGSGAKYVAQLCKHWGHKFAVEMDGETGIIPFGEATATLAPDATGIAIAISGEDRETVERLTGVVATHIDRFAFREAPLAYDWAWREEA